LQRIAVRFGDREWLARGQIGRDHYLHADRKRNHAVDFTARTTASNVALSTPREIRTVTAPITTSITYGSDPAVVPEPARHGAGFEANAFSG
jgi:hypothetical protein